jgi:beta-lactamase regulating signal transducer with metallopeptidase domain
MSCMDAAIAAGGAIHVLDTTDASAAIDAINTARAAGGAIEATGMMAAIAGWLLAVSWQLLPLTAVVIILDLALRRAGPVVRSALWWVVLAKLVVPPGLASPVSIAQLWPVDGVSAIITDTAAAPEARSDSKDLVLSGKSNHASGAATLLAIWAARAAGAVGMSSSPLAMANAAAPEARSDWRDLVLPWKSNRASGAATSPVTITLLVIWAIGAIAAAVTACWRYRRVRAACLEGAALLSDAAPEIHETAVAAARQLNLSKLPPIFVAAPDARAAGLPAVIGFLAPSIVLPRPLLERPRVEIEHVLLHELAHVRRGDPLTSLVCLVAQIVFWFHPAVWCARRRLATLREMACDRTVARVLGDATPAYRRTLILLARSAALATTASATATASAAAAAASASSRFAGGPGALGLFQRQSELVTRLDALARPVSMRRATEYAASAAIAAAILVSCVPLAPARAAPTVSIDVPPLDQLPGSLQKRYAVMRAMTLAEQAQPPQPSR